MNACSLIALKPARRDGARGVARLVEGALQITLGRPAADCAAWFVLPRGAAVRAKLDDKLSCPLPEAVLGAGPLGMIITDGAGLLSWGSCGVQKHVMEAAALRAQLGRNEKAAPHSDAAPAPEEEARPAPPKSGPEKPKSAAAAAIIADANRLFNPVYPALPDGAAEPPGEAPPSDAPPQQGPCKNASCACRNCSRARCKGRPQRGGPPL